MRCDVPGTHPRRELARLFAWLAAATVLPMRLHERTLLVIEGREQGWFTYERLASWLLLDAASLLLAYLGVWLLVRGCQERWNVLGSRRVAALLAVCVALMVLGAIFFAWLYAPSFQALRPYLLDSAFSLQTVLLYIEFYNVLEYVTALLLMAWLSLRLFQRTLISGEPAPVTAHQLVWFVTLLYLAVTLQIQGLLFDLFELDFAPLRQLGPALVLWPVLAESAMVWGVASQHIREPRPRLAPGRLLSSVALLVLLRTLMVLAAVLVHLWLDGNLYQLLQLTGLGLALFLPLTALCLSGVHRGGAGRFSGNPTIATST